MLNLDLVKIAEQPFEHIVKENFIDPVFYNNLCQHFPKLNTLNLSIGWQKDYSIFFDDKIFQDLMAQSTSWKKLFESIQSQKFVDYCVSQFRSVSTKHECKLNLDQIKFVNYCESSSERGNKHIDHPGCDINSVFVQPQIIQGDTGYCRTKHLDRRRRFVTVLIYFCDSEADNRVGGDLTLIPPSNIATEVSEINIAPKHNRMVAFACTNTSYHSVSKILAQTAPRNFMSIFVSSFFDIWPVDKYQYTEWCQTKIRNDSHFEFDNHYYSVPSEYIHCNVDVSATDTTLTCFYQGNCIAGYQRKAGQSK